ncbi:MAG TPA: prolyl oligopeptidase family serine peptidase [Thermoanaerobaculia bacterium]|nr:prolyl oligopeptidase family serine peptidase [Thermoanaerobaculia bacterium]
MMLLAAALSVDLIMRGHGIAGWPPQNVRWSWDDSRVYFEWKQASDPPDHPFDTWVVNRDGSGACMLGEEEAKDAPPYDAVWSEDRTLAAYIDDGDVFLYDALTGHRRALTNTTEAESHARVTADGRGVTFMRNDNLFLMNVSDGSLRQLTNITHDAEPAKKPAAEQYLADEEKKLLDAVARADRKYAEEKAKEKTAFRLEGKQSVDDLMLMGDGRFVVAILSEKPDAHREANVPKYVTRSAYTEEIPTRTKAGENDEVTSLVTIDSVTGDVHPLVIPSVVEGPGRADGAPHSPPGPSTPLGMTGAVRVTDVVFSRSRWQCAFYVRSLDWKDAWLVALDPTSGKGRVLDHQHDDAWINTFAYSNGVLDDGRVWFTSEASGWSHLYTVPWSGGTAKAITSGAWEVRSVRPTFDERAFDIATSETSAFEQQLERVPIDGGARHPLTTQHGTHDAIASNDGQSVADVFSYTNRPPELFVNGARASRPQSSAVPADDQRAVPRSIDAKQITHSTTPAFEQYAWQDAPIVHFAARDGVSVPARLYKPAQPNGSAVIFVHGAGYLQNVYLGWSYYFREYMFHHLLMERGAVVMDVDYRGSAGYGRAWRTAIYRHMGGIDLDDQVDAARWLVREHGVDAKRIAIYGGSYGGFITLMAMFTQPDVFAAGAALRPVTDWAHYNHEYTTEILNLPQDDREAYRRSSPIYFAEGLKGALLICHGMVDTNVHFQDSVRLAQRLIELRKENWELAPYPVENHGFDNPTSWADEYKRILKLLERTIL